jgi:hypothetical protein
MDPELIAAATRVLDANRTAGRMVAVAEIRGEVNKMLRNDDERAEAIAFLKTFSPDDIRAERRGRK